MSETQWLDKWECDRCSVIWHAKKEDAHVDYEKMVNGRMRLLCPKCFNQVARQSLRDMVDENKRLRGALQTIATWDARSTSQRIQIFAKAALTPQAGKGGGE